MKKMYDSFCEDLKDYPIVRGMCIVALVCVFSELLVLAVMHQATGVVPSTTTLNFLLWHWHLPINISRLWDIMLAPLFIYLTLKNEQRRDRKSDENFYEYGFDDEYSETDMNTTQMSLFLAYIGSGIFGILYAIPIFIAMCPFGIIIIAAVFHLILVPCIALIEELRKRCFMKPE